jgi:hypothetical protein
VTSLTRSSLFDVTGGVAAVLVKGGCGRIWNGIHLVGGAPLGIHSGAGLAAPASGGPISGAGKHHAACAV